MSPQLVGVSFEDLVDTLGEGLFDHRTGRKQYLLDNVGPLSRFGKLTVIALAGTQVGEAMQYKLHLRLVLTH